MGIVCFWPWYTMRFPNYAEYIEGAAPSCLTYRNFLEYDKNVIKDCLMSYSDYLRRHREPGLIRILTKS